MIIKMETLLSETNKILKNKEAYDPEYIKYLENDDYKEFMDKVDFDIIKANQEAGEPNEEDRLLFAVMKLYPNENKKEILSRIDRNKIVKKNLTELYKTPVPKEKLVENHEIEDRDLQIEIASYHNSTSSTITTTYEKELEGSYCINPRFLYRNRDSSDDHLSCLDIYWKCNVLTVIGGEDLRLCRT
jgi:hypothetical protein